MDNMKTLIILVIAVLIALIVTYYIFINYNRANNLNAIEYGGNIMRKSEYTKKSFEKMTEEIEDLNTDEYVILDVRTKQEYNSERIPNATLLTLDDIEYKAESILLDKNTKIYVYCRSGNRSITASYKLLDLGYTNVYDVGGIIDYPYETIR